MFNFIILFILLSTGGVFSATVLKRKFEEGIPLYFMSIMLFLYVFYLFDALKIGLFLIVLASIIFYVLSILRVVKTKEYKNTIERLVTPGALCFGVIYVLIYLLTKDSLLHLFDELRLWGAYPKALYFTDKIQLGNTLLYDSMSMNTYLPGMPLFQYFCLNILGGFQEHYLHFSFCLLGTSLFLPILKNVSWKKFYLIFPYIIFIIFTPMIFYNNGFDEGFYYKSLFVDSILGLAIGYNFYLLSKNPYKNKFNLINYLLSLSLVYLLKENGIIFVLISVFFGIVLEVFYYKNRNYKKIKSYANLLIPLLFSILLFLSWKITLNAYDKISDVTSEFTINNVIKLVTKSTPIQKEVTSRMINETKERPIVGSNISYFNKYLTFKNIMIFYLSLSIIIILMVPEKEKIKYFLSFLAVIGQSIAYWVALLLLFILKYKNVLCFERYNATTLLAIFVVLSLIIIDKAIKKEKYFQPLLITLLSFVILIPFRTIGDTTLVYGDYNKEIVEQQFMEANEIESQIIKGIEKKRGTTNIYFASSEQFPIVHHRLHFAFQDNNVSIKNIFGSMTDWPDSKSYVSYLLYEKYDYVYVYNYDDKMSSFSEGVFDEGLKEKTLYKIVNENNKTIMKEVVN